MRHIGRPGSTETKVGGGFSRPADFGSSPRLTRSDDHRGAVGLTICAIRRLQGRLAAAEPLR